MRAVKLWNIWLTIFCIGALSACQPQIPTMTPEEAKQIDALTQRMTTRCVGRYLIDLPEKFVLNDQSRAELEGVQIEIKSMTRRTFDEFFEYRQKQLAAKRQPGKDRNRPHLRQTIPLSDGIGAIFDRAESDATSDRSGRALELYTWRDGFHIVGLINATDLTFPEDANDSIAKQLKTDVQEKLAQLLNVYERLQGRRDDEIPTGQGVCFANGFLKGPPTDHEWIDMHHHWSEVEDVYFSYHHLTDIGKQDTTLLQRGDAIEENLSKVNGKTLRKGKREQNSLAFDEWLLQREYTPGVTMFDYTLEVNSEHGNAARPLFVLDMVSGSKHPRPAPTLEQTAVARPIEKASLNAAQSMALWDKVTATLRPRPGAF